MRILLPFIIILTLLFSACEKDINLDLQGTSPQLVVNGWITNTPANVPAVSYFPSPKLGPITNTSGYIVKLTTTANYYASNNTPPVSGAIVIITGSDNPSVKDTLVETPAGSGTYVGKSGQVGKPGVTYSLYIKYNNQTYTAHDLLDSIPPIDSASYTLNTGRGSKTKYRITYYTHNIPGNHYYLFKYYRNDSLLENTTTIDIAGTQYFVNPNAPELNTESPYLYKSSDFSYFELYSISDTLYNYYSQLSQQLSTSGPGGGFATVFTTVPANVHGNISNGGLGFFQASMYWTRTDSIK